MFGKDSRTTAQGIAVHSPGDAQAWRSFDQRMAKAAKTLGRWMRAPPGGHAVQTKARSGFFAGAPARQGREPRPRDGDFARSVDRRFSRSAVRGAGAQRGAGVRRRAGSALGPRSPGRRFVRHAARARRGRRRLCAPERRHGRLRDGARQGCRSGRRTHAAQVAREAHSASKTDARPVSSSTAARSSTRRR